MAFVGLSLFFRIFEIAYFGKKPVEGYGHHEDHAEVAITEARPSALLPLVATAVIIVLLGVFNRNIVELIEHSLSGMEIIGSVVNQVQEVQC